MWHFYKAKQCVVKDSNVMPKQVEAKRNGSKPQKITLLIYMKRSG